MIDRLLDRIRVESPGCWIWTGNLLKSGYGMLTIDNKNRMAHRLVWETLVGEIPEGSEMDHLCRVRCCVNPDHLEPVNHRVNVSRSASPTTLRLATGKCKNGHVRTPENTRTRDGVRGRICLDCSAMYQARRRERDRASRPRS